MAFFGRVGNILRHATNSKINSELCVSYATDEQSLREMFSKYGEVVNARIIMDRETGRSKGFGFITYSTVEEASNAIQALDGQDVQGRRIGVNFAIEKPRGFGGGGSYGNASYGAGTGTGYTGGYGNSPYGAASSAGGYGDAGGYSGGNVPRGNGGGGYGGGGYASGNTYNNGASGGYGGNNAI